MGCWWPVLLWWSTGHLGTRVGKEQQALEMARCGVGGNTHVCVHEGVCMDLHVCVGMDVHLYTCTCTCIHTCVAMYAWMYISMRVCAWIYVSMGVCVCVYAVAHMCEYVHVHRRACMCVLVHAAGLHVHGAIHTPTATTSCCRELSSLAHVCVRVCVITALPGPALGRTDGQKEPVILARRATRAMGSSKRCRLPACPAASCLRMLLPLGREDARQQPGFPVLPGRRVGQDVHPRAWTPLTPRH